MQQPGALSSCIAAYCQANSVALVLISVSGTTDRKLSSTLLVNQVNETLQWRQEILSSRSKENQN